MQINIKQKQKQKIIINELIIPWINLEKIQSDKKEEKEKKQVEI